MPARLLCLCAAWCDQCTAYGPTFDAVAQRLRADWPGLQTRWIDIEDEAELVGSLEIETFPTIVVACGEQVRFHGPLMPQAQVLERVAREALQHAVAPPPADPAVLALVRRVAGQRA